eukprot:12950034-Alexandrium_andersonii.AAC.1
MAPTGARLPCRAPRPARGTCAPPRRRAPPWWRRNTREAEGVCAGGRPRRGHRTLRAGASAPGPGC